MTFYRDPILIVSTISDGWAKDDLVYVWQEDNPVQLASNLSLPGGFQLGAFGSEYCDVKTTTGSFYCQRFMEKQRGKCFLLYFVLS